MMNMFFISIMIFVGIASTMVKMGINNRMTLSAMALVCAIILPKILLISKKGLRYYIKKQKYLSCSLKKVDKLPGEEFETFLQVNLEDIGYRVKPIGSSTGDFGGDLILKKGRNKILVQAKRYSNNVGVKAVQEALSAKEYYNCNKAMVITNSYYTKAAKTMASKCNVILWDRDNLVRRFNM